MHNISSSIAPYSAPFQSDAIEEIPSLPLELLQEIFSYCIPNFAFRQTCTYWNKASQHEGFWSFICKGLGADLPLSLIDSTLPISQKFDLFYKCLQKPQMDITKTSFQYKQLTELKSLVLKLSKEKRFFIIHHQPQHQDAVPFPFNESFLQIYWGSQSISLENKEELHALRCKLICRGYQQI